MIKVSDYIAKRLGEHGITDVFMITGGGAMHLNDSLGNCSALKYHCSHHEQACAIAAEGYARVTGKLAVVNVTSGPGGTNTLTGVLGQWLDSVPALYLSGQVKFETTIAAYPDLGLRQLGDQEINIVDIVKPITKYAAMVVDPLDIKMLIDKSIKVATTGRPGPVWLDIPLNIQAALIDESELREYNETEDDFELDNKNVKEDICATVDLLQNAKRPVVIAGQGIRIANAQKHLFEFIEKTGIPVLSTFNGFDLIDTNNKYFVGRIGTLGQRAGNFALQNADLIISIGSRNNIRQVSYNWDNFAHAAKKIVVDIDPAELNKPTVKADLKINMDADQYLKAMVENLKISKLPEYRDWLDWCVIRKNKYSVVLPEYKTVKDAVQPYYFAEVLTEEMPEKAIGVAGNGTACVSIFQAGKVKKGTRFFWNSGCASMGYDLPAAIGACIGSGNLSTVCVAGDGSLQMNIQELQTIKTHKLPVKIFYLNNNGYSSIKQTQDNFFQGRRTGCGNDCGVGFPDIIKIAEAYGVRSFKINNHDEMRGVIKEVLALDEPVLCEVMLQEDYIFSPKLSSEKLPDGTMVSKPLEDLYPFLSRDEFSENMINTSDE